VSKEKDDIEIEVTVTITINGQKIEMTMDELKNLKKTIDTVLSACGVPPNVPLPRPFDPTIPSIPLREPYPTPFPRSPIYIESPKDSPYPFEIYYTDRTKTTDCS